MAFWATTWKCFFACNPFCRISIFKRMQCILTLIAPKFFRLKKKEIRNTDPTPQKTLLLSNQHETWPTGNKFLTAVERCVRQSQHYYVNTKKSSATFSKFAWNDLMIFLMSSQSQTGIKKNPGFKFVSRVINNTQFKIRSRVTSFFKPLQNKR